MIIRLSILIYLLSVNNYLKAQSYSLCNLHGSEKIEISSSLEGFKNEKEATEYIDKLLKTVKLPMNFQIRQCKSNLCRNNASSTMDENGTRYIIYDNKWFDKIETDTSNIKSLTILAHELGHHLSAHTLFVNEQNHQAAINVCDKRSENYDRLKCTNSLKSRYQNYLLISRKQELQADRFAGYIMAKYGTELQDVMNTYKSIMIDFNDSLSTHPTLNKRLVSLKNGYSLAKKNKKVDLFEIKGNPSSIKINDTKLKKDLEREKEMIYIIENLNRHITQTPRKKLNQISNFEISYILSSKLNSTLIQRINSYLGKESYTGGRKHYSNGEVFDCFNYSMNLRYKRNINFTNYPAYHIKDGILRIILFNEEQPRIIYKSICSKKDISFKEIELLLIEIYDNGLNKAIITYENKD